MAYPKLLSSAEILKTALKLVEQGNAEGLSLRAVASALGVKAPSLYRYFPNKEALEIAVAEEVLSTMQAVLQAASEWSEPEARFRGIVDAYLRFARERFELYSLIVQNRIPGAYGSKAGKAVWNLLLGAASGISGHRDDTAATVATWSFLHGYATLEHSGAFGASGPRGGLERGVESFLSNFRKGVPPIQEQVSSPAKGVRRSRGSQTGIRSS